MKVNILDLFSGIGGFHLGLKQSGFIFDWVGFSEIDKYASKQYKRRFPNAAELGDITTIQCEDLPKNIDILCGGFPCQAFSIAGKRKGFDDTRGTLFFEIARILRYFRGTEQPIPYFILENVKGLLNHEDGRTFATIYRVLADLDYSVECQLLNTRWFLPQNRERIYIVGRFRGGSRSKIFPIGKHGRTNNENRKKDKTRISAAPSREYGWKKVSPTLCSRDYKDPKLVKVVDKNLNKKNNQDYAACLAGGGHSGGNHSDMDLLQVADYRTDEGIRIRHDGDAPCLTASHSSENEPSRMQGLVIKPVLTPNRPEKRQNGRRFKEDGEDMFTLTSQDQHGVMEGSNIRRLTPTECERLQGFPDGWTEGQSDTQRYKQLGNAVSVPVVKAIGDKLITLL